MNTKKVYLMIFAIAIFAIAASVAIPEYRKYKNSPRHALKQSDPKRYELLDESIKESHAKLKKDEKNAGAWVQIGMAHEGFGEYEQAIESYEKALVISEGSSMVPWINLASIYRNQGRYDLARDAYKNAIRLFPADSQPYHNLIDLYASGKIGDLNEAGETLELGIKNTNDPDLKRILEKLNAEGHL